MADDLLVKKLNASGGALALGMERIRKTAAAKQKAKCFAEFQDGDKRERQTAWFPARFLEGAKTLRWMAGCPKDLGDVRKSIDEEGKNGLYILNGSPTEEGKTSHTGCDRISALKRFPMRLCESGGSACEASLLDLFSSEEMLFAESRLDFDGLAFA